VPDNGRWARRLLAEIGEYISESVAAVTAFLGGVVVVCLGWILAHFDLSLPDWLNTLYPGIALMVAGQFLAWRRLRERYELIRQALVAVELRQRNDRSLSWKELLVRFESLGSAQVDVQVTTDPEGAESWGHLGGHPKSAVEHVGVLAELAGAKLLREEGCPNSPYPEREWYRRAAIDDNPVFARTPSGLLTHKRLSGLAEGSVRLCLRLSSR
jgi:hypothetical protein